MGKKLRKQISDERKKNDGESKGKAAKAKSKSKAAKAEEKAWIEDVFFILEKVAIAVATGRCGDDHGHGEVEKGIERLLSSVGDKHKNKTLLILQEVASVALDFC